MDLLITILLIVFFVWLVGVIFGYFQTGFTGGPRNLLFLLLAILIVILLLREFGLLPRGRGRLFCDVTQDHQIPPSSFRGLLSSQIVQ